MHERECGCRRPCGFSRPRWNSQARCEVGKASTPNRHFTDRHLQPYGDIARLRAERMDIRSAELYFPLTVRAGPERPFQIVLFREPQRTVGRGMISFQSNARARVRADFPSKGTSAIAFTLDRWRAANSNCRL